MGFSAGVVFALGHKDTTGAIGNEADIVVRDQGQNMMNPHGIPGSQGPAGNIARAAGAIRGRNVPDIVTIERRVDPQYGVHAVQEEIPDGRDLGGGSIKRFPQSLPGQLYAGRQNFDRADADSKLSQVFLDHERPPSRIPRLWKDGLDMGAGIAQHGFTQWAYTTFLPHIWLGRVPQPTRGIRAISGARTPTGPTASRARIPAIYVPSVVG
jgi:hypothetical protein